MIHNAIIISLIVLAIHATTWRYMIFNELAHWLRKRLPQWLHKPLFDCPYCMTPYYGALLYLGLHYSHIKGFNFAGDIFTTIVLIVGTLAVAMGLNVFSMIAIQFMETCISFQEHIEMGKPDEIKPLHDIDDAILEAQKILSELKEQKRMGLK